MEHEILEWHLGGFTFHAKTLIMTWIVMAVLVVFGYIAGRNASNKVPRGAQNIWETVIDFVANLMKQNMDYNKVSNLLTYLVTLILFIFCANLLGLFPNFLYGILDEAPNMMSPTADISTTGGLAILTIILTFYYGIKYQGSHYFKHFFEPFALFFPIHIIELVSKPVTLAFRLFGNIFAGEVLISVILGMPIMYFALGGVVAQIIWLAFSVFVGAIQAFIFTMLTIAYVAQVLPEEGQEHH